MLKKVILLLCLSLSSQALAESPFSIGGKASYGIFHGTEEDVDNPLISRPSLWLKPTYNPTESLSVRVEGILDYHMNNEVDPDEDEEFRATLREGFVQYTLGGLDLRFGRQIFSWGPSDGVNPTDYFGVKDQTYFTFDEDNKRRGVTAFNATFIPDGGNSPYTFQFVAAPEAPKSDVLLPPFAPIAGIDYLDPHESQESMFDDINLGAQTKYTGDSWDAGISAYYGQSQIPEIQIIKSDMTGYDVALYHQKVSAFGIQGSYTFERWIFRIESSYKSYALEDGRKELLQPDIVDTVLGIERPIGDNVRTHFQLIIKNALQDIDPGDLSGNNPTDTQVIQGIKATNNLLLGMDSTTEFGATGRITLTLLDEQLELQLFSLWLADSTLTRPSIKYIYDGSIVTTVGTDLYAGNEDTPLGQLKPFSNVFAEISYLF